VFLKSDSGSAKNLKARKISVCVLRFAFKLTALFVKSFHLRLHCYTLCVGLLKQAQLRWRRAMAYGAMHQNQAQARAPLDRGAPLKGHCPSTLTNEPAPLGRGAAANPKGQCNSIFTNQTVPCVKGHHPKVIVVPLSHTNLPHQAGKHKKGYHLSGYHLSQ